MAMSRGILSTDPQYKKTKPKPAKKDEQPTELTAAEQRAVDKILDGYEAKQRKRYGLRSSAVTIR